ncbi:MAG: SDR family NAD(P)-dependent oxidoreductase [Pseudomonadales bacterium]
MSTAIKRSFAAPFALVAAKSCRILCHTERKLNRVAAGHALFTTGGVYMLHDFKLNRRNFLRLGAAAALTPTATACAGREFEISIDSSLPTSSFGSDSTAEEVTAGLDLSGKVALVTGCNSGLGFETMRVLAMRGAHVVGTGRTMEKAAVACEQVDGKATPVVLELSDFKSVLECANTVRQLDMAIDILVCNAGINTFGELELVNGIERMFVVNHLGHFVLVNQLLPLMQRATAGRVVHVGSRAGYRRVLPEGIDFDNLRGEKSFDASAAYGRSKLANALFSHELSKRLANSAATSNVIHPGLVKTNIARTAPGFMRGAFNLLGGLIAKTPEQGAATQTYVATAPALAGVSGVYFEDCNPVIVSGQHHMFDDAMAAKLWALSEQMSAGYLI